MRPNTYSLTHKIFLRCYLGNLLVSLFVLQPLSALTRLLSFAFAWDTVKHTQDIFKNRFTLNSTLLSNFFYYKSVFWWKWKKFSTITMILAKIFHYKSLQFFCNFEVIAGIVQYKLWRRRESNPSDTHCISCTSPWWRPPQSKRSHGHCKCLSPALEHAPPVIISF